MRTFIRNPSRLQDFASANVAFVNNFFICVAGFFYWVDQVQPYNQGGWSYMDELHKFVENGLEGEEFINAVSGIVNR